MLELEINLAPTDCNKRKITQQEDKRKGWKTKQLNIPLEQQNFSLGQVQTNTPLFVRNSGILPPPTSRQLKIISTFFTHNRMP